MESFEVDPLVGQKIMQAMGFDGFSIQNPENYKRYTEVAKYLSKFEDGAQIAQIVTRATKPQDRAAKLFEYVALRKDLENIRQQLRDMPSDNLISAEDTELQDQKRSYQDQEAHLLNEISMYE